MTATGVQHMERNIARCRVVLSVAAIVAMYIDPAPPLLSGWIPLASGPFVMDFRLVLVMGAHFLYSSAIYLGLWQEWLSPVGVGARTMWVDVLFGAAIGILTEGVTSPSFPFFAFAVVAVGLRAGLRPAVLVTAASVGLYMCLILISARGGAEVYIMRPIYLAITGYLVGYLGQQRIELQEEMRQFEVAEQRHRIARELHDGFAQALAGINLRLEGCRRTLRAHPAGDVLTELTELQDSVKHEFDELRTYTRSLAGLDATDTAPAAAAAPQLCVNAALSGSVDLVEHVLQIVREGINNVRRHARATRATIEIRTEDAQVHVSIDDDGVGFHGDNPPWSIASRVKEIGGRIQIVADERPGAHLMITLPHG